jgi:hypothetical protein
VGLVCTNQQPSLEFSVSAPTPQVAVLFLETTMSFKTSLAILEGLSLLTAFLDFTGWSQAIQKRVDKHRRRLFNWLYDKKHERLADAIGKIVWFPAAVLAFAIAGAYFVGSRYLGVMIGGYVLLTIVPIVVLFLLLPMFYNFLLFINKPPSGTVGTVSVSIALASFVLQHLGWLGSAWCRFIRLGCG